MPEEKDSDYETISIKRDLKRRIEKLGNKGEKWSPLLERLIFKEKNHKEAVR